MTKVVILFLLVSSSALSKTTCELWFSDNKLKKNDSCILKCQSASVDMSTFDCHDQCDKLCKDTDIQYSILKTYGLTEDEIKICDHSPSICVKAYLASIKAESICLSIYPSSRTNDESDACRHFQWSILLADDLGESDAEKILNAHENNPREPQDERAMDLANNRLGLLTYRSLKKSGPPTDLALTTSFKENLKSNKLVILKPHYKSTGGLP